MTDPTLAFGRTRTRVGPRHALLAPDGHVPAPVPGWREAEGVTLISPQLGSGVSARFTMARIALGAGGESAPPLPGIERFVFVVEGEVTLQRGAARDRIAAGGYAFLPAETEHALRAEAPARLVTFERRFLPRADAGTPEVVLDRLEARPSSPFLGDARIQVQRLLPDDPALDVAVNVMTYAPGASLPFVETHANEHGLYMLSGGGIYRLEQEWYPVTAGDAIWMGPYCPQWYGALGEAAGSYLLYKDEGRDWLAAAAP